MKQQWRRVWEIYTAAAELPEQERFAFVQSCGGSTETRSEVLALLRELEQPASPPPNQASGRAKSARYVLL